MLKRVYDVQTNCLGQESYCPWQRGPQGFRTRHWFLSPEEPAGHPLQIFFAPGSGGGQVDRTKFYGADFILIGPSVTPHSPGQHCDKFQDGVIFGCL